MSTTIKVLYIPVGIPGCGKTTFWNDRVKKEFPKAIRISPDDIRRKHLNSEVTKVFFDWDIEPQVWEESYDLLKYHLKRGYSPIYFDATHLTWRSRWNVSNFGQKAGYKVICVHFFIHPKLCFVRNLARENPVPHDAMVDMLRTYTSPKMPGDPYIDEIQQYKLQPTEEERVKMKKISLTDEIKNKKTSCI